jgi:DNA uptake protein ComE-like DNA-binding protein
VVQFDTAGGERPRLPGGQTVHKELPVMSPTRAIEYTALLAGGLFSFVLMARADEPKPPEPTPEQVSPSAEKQPASSATQPRPNTSPKGAAKGTAKQDARAKANAKAKKSLIAPPSLLLQAPNLATFTAPGLGKLNLNRATLDQLQNLPGVGVTWAPRILAGRPYSSLGDLARDGIPLTTIDALSQQVELGP